MIAIKVPVMNEIAPDVALTGELEELGFPPASDFPPGNHDFDFGSPTTVSMKLETDLLTKDRCRISPFNEAPPSDKFRTYIHFIHPSRVVVLIVFRSPGYLATSSITPRQRFQNTSRSTRYSNVKVSVSVLSDS